MRAHLCLATLSAALLACRAEPRRNEAVSTSTVSNAPAAPPYSLFTALWDAETLFVARFGTTRRDVTHRFGPALRTRGWALQDSSWGDVDSVVYLTYKDYEFAFLITRDRRDLLGVLTLLSGQDTLPNGLRVGMARNDLLALLSPDPSFREDKDTSFVQFEDPAAGGQNRIEFVVLGDTVRGITFRPWID